MQQNQYTTPTLHLVKPQPGSNNFGAAMNENLNKIDEGFKNIIASYNSTVKKIEGSSGYIAADQDYYLYTYIKTPVADGIATGDLYKIPRDITLPISETELQAYLVEKLEDLTTGAYVFLAQSGSEKAYNGDIRIDILGYEVWNHNDIILIQHIWRNSESRYETIGTKMPHLTGGYYAPDNAYKIENGIIEQTFKKQNTVQAKGTVQSMLPYTTYAPYLEQVGLGVLLFEEIIHLPELEGKSYVYKPYHTGKTISFPFSPVKATSKIKTIKFTLNGYNRLVGYPTDVVVEHTQNTSHLSQFTTNNLDLKFFDTDGSIIFANYELTTINNKYYIINKDYDFYLPEGATIQITIHSTTTASVIDANEIPDDYINELFPKEVIQEVDK